MSQRFTLHATKGYKEITLGLRWREARDGDTYEFIVYDDDDEVARLRFECDDLDRYYEEARRC